MKRFTQSPDNGTTYFVGEKTIKAGKNGYSGDVIDRLAKFENFYENLLADQIKTPKELEKLRREGKEKTYHYRELMAKKLTDGAIMRALKSYDL